MKNARIHRIRPMFRPAMLAFALAALHPGGVAAPAPGGPGLSSGAPNAPGEKTEKKREFRDALTHEDLVRRRETDDPRRPLAEFQEATGPDPAASNPKRDLVASSDIICYNGNATLVPKRAIISMPERYKTRLQFRPGSKILRWADFYRLNRGWITTVEINRLQAEGNVALSEETLEAVAESPNLVVATMKGGPISLLPPAESSAPVEAGTEDDEEMPRRSGGLRENRHRHQPRSQAVKTNLFPILPGILCLTLFGAGVSTTAQSASDGFTNFIRQIQFPSGVEYDLPVENTGTGQSPLSIEPGGGRFELWTVKNDPLTSYLLDDKYVGAYVPQAQIAVWSEDPYSVIPRTRADRPYWVRWEINGLLSGESDPPAAKQVRITLHAQSYGEEGTAAGIDRSEAQLIGQAYLTGNGNYNSYFYYHYVPGANQAKIRGEERLSVYTIEDYQAPEAVIDSKYIQIWPIADATITGVTQGASYKGSMPEVTLTLNDLYPDSQTYAQVYKGSPQSNVDGDIVPGSALIVYESIPQDRILTLRDWDGVFDEDGTWTMEILTSTPFGVDRLASVTFDVDRTIKVNTSVTTVE